MRKFNLIIVFLLFYSLNAGIINISNIATDLTLINNGNYLEGMIHVKELVHNNISYKDNNFTTINIPGYHTSQDIGLPELPQINQLIEIPQDAIPRIEIISEEISYYSLDELTINNPIFPHQPSLSKSQDIDDIGLFWNKNYYNQNSYNHKDLITVDIEGTLRPVRIGNLNIKWILIDHYGLSEIWEKLASNKYKVAVIDDLKNRNRFCDLYINYHYLPFNREHQKKLKKHKNRAHLLMFPVILAQVISLDLRNFYFQDGTVLARLRRSSVGERVISTTQTFFVCV